MQPIPVLEDPSYPGRTGGYVTRITGKLLHEAAILGNHLLFLPSPQSAATHYVFAGGDPSSSPLVQVPQEFYRSVYERIKAIFGIGEEASSGEKVVDYGGTPYTFRVELLSEPIRGVRIHISRPGT